MSLWGRNNQSVTANSSTTKESTNGAPLFTSSYVKGSGNGDNPVSMDANSKFGNTSSGSTANVDVNLFDNTTPGAFITNMAVGVFGVSATEMSNNIANSSKERPAHAGWVMRRAGTGPVTGVFVNANAGPFMNGETVTVSGGEVNAVATVSTNATGNIVSLALTVPGSGFINVSNSTAAFDREKWVSAIAVSGTPTGYSNTDVVTASNVQNGIINATMTFVTNATGGFVTANVTITNKGLYKNAQLAAGLQFHVANSTGGNSAGSGATFTPTLANSTGGTVYFTLGGRAGRVSTETLVAMGSLGAQSASYGTPALVANAGTNAQANLYPGN